MLYSLLTTFINTSTVVSDKVYEQAVIWNGFEQSWGYNHRINRLGDYTGALNCDTAGECVVPWVHTAATGSGSDTATYQTQLLNVSAPEVGFLQGSTNFHVDEPRGEGNTVHYHTTQRLWAQGLLKHRQQLHVILGGFDLHAVKDPDKLSQFDISVANARYAYDGNWIVFDVDLDLKMDCDSAECDRFDHGVDYDVSVMWTLMAADQQLHVSHTQIENSYDWQKGRHAKELEIDQFQYQGLIQGQPGAFLSAFTAFQRISVTLDHDHHYQQWATRLSPPVYDPVGGAAEVGVTLFFKQWNQTSRRLLFSYTDRGSAQVQTTVALIQLQQGAVVPETVYGTMVWKANGEAASEAQSQQTQNLRLAVSP